MLRLNGVLLLFLSCLAATTRVAHSFAPRCSNLLPACAPSAAANDDNNNKAENDSDDNNLNTRRRLFQYTLAAATTYASPLVASAASTSPLLVPTPKVDSNLDWPLGKVAFSLLPLAGGSRRATVQETILEDKIWTHDQIQGVVNVNVPVRQTTIALKGGGLWVHNPVAPTPQHVERMRELEKKYGPVKHVVLGTVALEHKATFGAFARKFKQATVWIQPGMSTIIRLRIIM